MGHLKNIYILPLTSIYFLIGLWGVMNQNLMLLRNNNFISLYSHFFLFALIDTSPSESLIFIIMYHQEIMPEAYNIIFHSVKVYNLNCFYIRHDNN